MKVQYTLLSEIHEFFFFHFDFEEELQLGQVVTVELFEEGTYVDVVGTSKGKGFQGVVKRHGFAGVGQATHGQHNRLRAPGSIGAGSDPSRVFKGMRMAGRMGGKRAKVQNLQVFQLHLELAKILLANQTAHYLRYFFLLHSLPELLLERCYK